MLGLAAVLAPLGALTWPPGGLMFALPFIFLIPAGMFGIFGGAALLLAYWLDKRGTTPSNE
jgi:hypothetical protein